MPDRFITVEKYTATPEYRFERVPLDNQPNGDFRLRDGREAPPGKPLGSWVSVPGGNPDWPEWCKMEEWGLGSLKYRHVYTLDTAKVLMITSAGELDAFTDKYKVSVPLGQGFTYDLIRWRDVAAQYSGIVISPYQWSRRLHRSSHWYYGWDCASGCIWEPGVLTQVMTGPFAVSSIKESAE